MAGNLVVLDQKAPGATVSVVFDFISFLPSGVTLSAPVVQATVWAGVDGAPAAIISGSAAVSGSQVTQLITGGVAGVLYKLTAQATASNGQTLIMYGYLAVVGDPL